jgi:hypothetical protein
MLIFSNLSLIVVHKHTAASSSTSPPNKGQHWFATGSPNPMCTNPPNKSTQAPNFSESAGHDAGGDGVTGVTGVGVTGVTGVTGVGVGVTYGGGHGVGVVPGGVGVEPGGVGVVPGGPTYGGFIMGPLGGVGGT